MTLLAVSDVVWQAIIAAVVTLALAYMNQRTKNAVVEAAVSANNYKKDTDDQLKVIHALGNSQMGAQKRLLAVTARAKAHITNDPIDVKAAEAAETELASHEVRQASADKTQENQTK